MMFLKYPVVLVAVYLASCPVIGASVSLFLFIGFLQPDRRSRMVPLPTVTMFTYLVLLQMTDYGVLTKEQRRVAWDDCITPITQSILGKILNALFWISALLLLTRTTFYDQPLRHVWPVLVLLVIAQGMIVEPLVILARLPRIRSFIELNQKPRSETA